MGFKLGLALIEAIPGLREVANIFVIEYVKYQMGKNGKEFLDSLDKARFGKVLNLRENLGRLTDD